MEFTLEQALTPFPHTIQAQQSVSQAHAMLIEHDVRHLPVEHEGQIIGVISERDINLTLNLAGQTSESVSVFTLCRKPAYLVEKSEPIALVMRNMAEHRYGSVLVTERGKLIGIVTTSDLLRLMAVWLEREGE